MKAIAPADLDFVSGELDMKDSTICLDWDFVALSSSIADHDA